jgi:hypothetical protein
MCVLERHVKHEGRKALGWTRALIAAVDRRVFLRVLISVFIVRLILLIIVAAVRVQGKHGCRGRTCRHEKEGK